MKSLFLKLVPGAVVTLLSMIALGAFSSRAQTNQAPAPAAMSPERPQNASAAVIQAQPAAELPVIMCGVCGAQIGQPQYVMVAPAVRRHQAERVVYIDRANEIIPAYYPEPARRVNFDPFSEIQVNALPYQPRAMVQSSYCEVDAYGRIRR